VLLLLFAFFYANARHTAGIEFEYRVIGPNQLEIALYWYGDCQGGVFEPAVSYTISSPDSLSFSQIVSGGSMTDFLAPLEGFEFRGGVNYSASNYCLSQANSTGCVNGGSIDYTIRQYKDTLHLPPWSNKWLIRHQATPSPAYVTNMDPVGLHESEVFIDFGKKQGSGPIWFMRDFNFAHANQPIVMNWGGFSHDSVTVKAIDFPGGGYSGPFTASQPMHLLGTYDLNPQGDLQFTPDGIQSPYVAFRVEEFDSLGNLIAYSTRTRLLKIADPNSGLNTFPIIDSITRPVTTANGKTFIELEPGNNSFSISLPSPSSNLINLWESNQLSVPGASFNLNFFSPTRYRLDVFVPQTAIDQGEAFLLKTSSMQCPYKMPIYLDLVLKRASCEFTQDTFMVCPEGNAIEGIPGYQTWNWSPGSFVSDSTSPNPIVLGGNSGFLHLSTEACMDSIFIETLPGPNPNLGSDTQMCQNDALFLDPQLQGFPIASIQYDPFPDSIRWNQYPTVLGGQTNRWIVDVTGTNGCKASDTLFVSTPIWDIIGIEKRNIPCVGAQRGSIKAKVNSNQVNYLWNDPAAQTDSIAVNLASGTYMVLVTDTGGCIDTASASIYSDSFSFNIGSVVSNLCRGTSLEVGVSNFQHADPHANYQDTVHYSMFWQGLNILDSISRFKGYFSADTASEVTAILSIVGDSSGCAHTDTLVVPVSSVAYSVDVNPGCLDSSYNSSLSFDLDRVSANHFWRLDGSSSISGNPVSYQKSYQQPYITNYRLIVSGTPCQGIASGSFEPDTSCVWPGDMNHDGFVDNFDVFSYALYQWKSGPARTRRGTSWKPRKAQDWGVLAAGFADGKHSDADGSGRVNPIDFSQIIAKYTRSHLKDMGEGEGPAPTILVEFSKDTFYPGDTVEVYYSILLEDSIVYALVFRHFFRPAWAIPSSIRFDYHGVFDPSGMGQPNALSISQAEGTEYHWGIVSRLLSGGVDTSGLFATMRFQLPTDILSGIDTVIPLKLNLFAQESMTRNGVFLGADIQEEIAFVKGYETGVKGLNAADFFIYPNPATGSVTMELDQVGGELRLSDLIGNQIQTKEANSRKVIFKIDHLPAGTYLIEYSLDGLSQSRRFIKY
jgi:hypothetical protein